MPRLVPAFLSLASARSCRLLVAAVLVSMASGAWAEEAVAASAPAAPAIGGTPGAGPVIAAVWRTASACTGTPLSRDALTPDPDGEAVRRARLVTLARQHLQFQVPAVPGLSSIVLRIAADDRSRGVVDQYLLFSEADLAPPRAAVVVTDLPRGIDTRERAFDSVRHLESQLAANTGAYPSFAPVDGPYGDAMEMIVPGRVAAGCFPTARFATAARTADGVPFSISRFAWVGGRLVEFALALSFPARMTLEDQHARAQAEMETFWGGLSVF